MALGIWSGIVAAGVPGRMEYWNVKALAKRDARTTSSVLWKSSSVSPGKPTMRSVVIAASGQGAHLAQIDADLGRELGATLPQVWPVLLAAADGEWIGELAWRGAPYGVGW